MKEAFYNDVLMLWVCDVESDRNRKLCFIDDVDWLNYPRYMYLTLACHRKAQILFFLHVNIYVPDPTNRSRQIIGENRIDYRRNKWYFYILISLFCVFSLEVEPHKRHLSLLAPFVSQKIKTTKEILLRKHRPLENQGSF